MTLYIGLAVVKCLLASNLLKISALWWLKQAGHSKLHSEVLHHLIEKKKGKGGRERHKLSHANFSHLLELLHSTELQSEETSVNWR